MPCRSSSPRSADPPGAEQRWGVAGRGQQQGVRVRRGLHELQVVARVEPTALDVDRAADLVKITDQVVAVVVRDVVRRRRRVVEVRGLPIERAGDHVSAVALGLEERARVHARDRRRDQLRSRPGTAARPLTGCRSRRGRSRRGHVGEVELADEVVPLAPRADVAADRALQDRGAARGLDPERLAGEIRGREHERDLGRRRRVADLVDPDERGRAASGCSRRGRPDGRTHRRASSTLDPDTRAAIIIRTGRRRDPARSAGGRCRTALPRARACARETRAGAASDRRCGAARRPRTPRSTRSPRARTRRPCSARTSGKSRAIWPCSASIPWRSLSSSRYQSYERTNG